MGSQGRLSVAGGLAGLVSLTGIAQAAEQVDVHAELAALKAEVAALRAESSESWLNERRAEEVKGLIQEVLADAETRASLAEGGVTAGYNKGFYLASEDGNFLLELEGQVQARYIWFHDGGDDANPDDDDEAGFQMRRAKLGFSGHIYDPRLQYKIKAGFDRDGGNFVLEEAYAKYFFLDDTYVQVGQFKGPFLKEEWTSSTRQIAVERSSINEFFTLDYSQGVMLGTQFGDNVKAYAAIHDGREQDNVNWQNDFTEFAVAGRVEWLAAGKWSQFKDFHAWSKDPFGIMLGAAVDYEATEDGGTNLSPIDDFVQWTVDASVDAQPFSFFTAFVARHANDDTGIAGGQDLDQYGFIAQASAFIVPDKWDVFGRYEWLDTDGFGEVTSGSFPTAVTSGLEEEQTIYTVGTNYYFHGHASKVTLDLLYAPDGIRRGESGLGLIETESNDDVMAVRAQYQLLF